MAMLHMYGETLIQRGNVKKNIRMRDSDDEIEDGEKRPDGIDV